jgi:hypothetical protein
MRLRHVKKNFVMRKPISSVDRAENTKLFSIFFPIFFQFSFPKWTAVVVVVVVDWLVG